MGNRKFNLRGINHLALVCSDMKRTVDFYGGVLGMPLIKTVELPNGRGQHFFFDIGNGNSLAFFWFPGAPEPIPGVVQPAWLPGRGNILSAVGSMNHVAFDVAPDDLDGYVERLRDHGVDCTDVVNHDDSELGWASEMHPGVFVRSVYFFDPDGLSLEFAAWARALTSGDVRHQPSSLAGQPA